MKCHFNHLISNNVSVCRVTQSLKLKLLTNFHQYLKIFPVEKVYSFVKVFPKLCVAKKLQCVALYEHVLFIIFESKKYEKNNQNLQKSNCNYIHK